ncbi:MAG: NUDIX domain-containing protein [Anaerolineales bacterium]|nr:NUDIX domain-containing protein [Anaerolineales bacterium]
MTQVLYGPRLGREGELRVGCCAVLFDQSRKKVLLTRRVDNGRWCLPGGRMESGESAAETCEREFWEETGLKVRATRLIGVYSNPEQLVIYPDGMKVFMVVMSFEVNAFEGQLGLSEETTDFGFYSLDEMDSMPMHGEHKMRVEDAIRGGDAAIK